MPPPMPPPGGDHSRYSPSMSLNVHPNTFPYRSVARFRSLAGISTWTTPCIDHLLSQCANADPRDPTRRPDALDHLILNLHRSGPASLIREHPVVFER